jgi:heme/copper-type cytochrome/quinol oxidase subunit 2
MIFSHLAFVIIFLLACFVIGVFIFTAIDQSKQEKDLLLPEDRKLARRNKIIFSVISAIMVILLIIITVRHFQIRSKQTSS